MSNEQTATDRSLSTRLADWWADRPYVDLRLGALVVIAHLLVKMRWDGTWTLAEVVPGQRSLVYGALATVAALAAGSNNTAVGSYVSSQGKVIDGLRVRHGATLRAALHSIGSWLWTVAVLALCCFALDPNLAAHPTKTRGAEWVAEFVLFMLALKFLRLTLVQDLILKANDLTAPRPPKKKLSRRHPYAPVTPGSAPPSPELGDSPPDAAVC